MRNALISAAKIVAFVVLFAGLLVAFLLVAGPEVGLKQGVKPEGNALLALTAAQLVAVFIAASIMFIVGERKSPMAMGFDGKLMLPDLVTGMVFGGFIFLVGLTVAFFNGWVRIDPQMASFSMAALGFSAVFIFLAAAFEEVMMRGYVLQMLMAKYSTAASIVVSSLIFVALHAGNLIKDPIGIMGAINIFVASILMSVAYLRTGALWLPIGVHAGWNFMQGPVLGINVSGYDLSAGWHVVTLQGPKWATGGQFGFEAAVPAVIGPLVGIALIYLFFRKEEASGTSDEA
jgi:uncharacterized protein